MMLPYYLKTGSLSVSDSIISHSGDSDTESTTETFTQSYKCHICAFKPDLNKLIYLIEQAASNDFLSNNSP